MYFLLLSIHLRELFINIIIYSHEFYNEVDIELQPIFRT